MITISQWWMWLSFFALIGVVLTADLFIFGGRKAHRVSTKEALSWTIIWFLLSLIFNFLLWLYLKNNAGIVIANQKAVEFLTGYLIEKSLSIDNVFVIIMIFSYFSIPPEYQRRVLIYGVIGAILMRLILITFGIFLVSKFSWILYLFGVFLIITGIKMFVFADHKPDLSKNPALIWMRNHLRITHELHNEKFYIKRNSVLYFTPLFIVLVLVEITDLIFAVDSIPAVFAITHDPFIVFTSNIFAILGLRALYFLFLNMHNKFHLLKYGLALILVFVGFKMLIVHWIKIPIFLSLGVVILTLLASIFFSIYHNYIRKK